MNIDPKNYTYTIDNNRNRQIFFLGLILILVSVLIGYKHQEFYFSYLTSYFFWLSIALGGIFFTLVHYAFSAVWSVSIRRIMENTIIVIPIMTILFIPILIGMESLFSWMPSNPKWSIPGSFEADHLIQHKLSFLNQEFFLVRAALYFLLWNFIVIYIYKKSIKNDTIANNSDLDKLRLFSMSPIGVLFFLSLTFAGFDWQMSLDPHWYSTMFGVYTFAGSFLAFLAFLTFTIIHLQSKGLLKNIVTSEHYHDLGKYLFAFTVFYCYIAGAQFYFIWYSNIPEETIWYLHRWVGSWKIISVLLIVGKFFIPFFSLIFRASKRNLGLLKYMSLWIIFMHYIDINFIIMPTYHHHDFHFGIYDLLVLSGIGLVFIASFRHRLSQNPLIPVNDPELINSINHRNH